MDKPITLYHPVLDRTITVAARSAKVHKASGWEPVDPKPKRRRSTQPDPSTETPDAPVDA